jgi:PIN domain nuclease of toxin-antitoxin system
MPSVVADTHALLWSLLQPQKLSTNALAVFDQARRLGDPVYVASISLVETLYLEEKGKLQKGILARLKNALQGEDGGLVLVPLDSNVAEAIERIPRDAIPDMPDRIIAATALSLNLPLVTRDGKIKASGITTIW